MKAKLFSFIIAALFVTGLSAQNEFITVWKPSNPSTATVWNPLPVKSNTNQVFFPGVGANYTIYWEETGYPAHNATLTNVTTTATSPLLIDFGTALNPIATDATYTVKVSNGAGNFTKIECLRGDNEKITAIVQWGNIQWSTMEEAFARCKNINITATDTPNLSSVSSLRRMFFFCDNLSGSTANWNWNTAQVTDMSEMFFNDGLFNADISGWNTSNVTTMFEMFFAANTFNQPIGNWQTSNVTNMESMFGNATDFNHSLENWNTSKVTNMSGMFLAAEKFNQPLTNWNTSEVTDMSNMFAFATAFNQPLNHFVTSKVINMSAMFKSASAFNQPLDQWKTAGVKYMSNMFWFADAFNQNINSWDVSNVISMQSMFSDITHFNQPLNNWNTQNVEDMSYMFYNCTAFDQNIGNWNLAKISNGNLMLNGAGISCVNYDATLIGWAANVNTPNSIDLGDAAPLKYSGATAAVARQKLTDPVASGGKGWTITGDTYDAGCNTGTGVDSPKKGGEIHVSPNPASTHFTIQGLERETILTVYDVAGKKVFEKNISPDEKVDVSGWNKGVYFVKTENGTGKLIIR